MKRAIELLLRAAETASNRHGFGMQRSAKMGQNPQQQIAIEFGKRATDDAIYFQQFGRIGAGLDNDVVRFLHDEQRAVRLD